MGVVFGDLRMAFRFMGVFAFPSMASGAIFVLGALCVITCMIIDWTREQQHNLLEGDRKSVVVGKECRN